MQSDADDISNDWEEDLKNFDWLKITGNTLRETNRIIHTKNL